MNDNLIDIAQKKLESEVGEFAEAIVEFMEDYCKKNNTSALVLFNGLVNVVARSIVATSNNLIEIRDDADKIKSAIIDLGVMCGKK